MVRKIGFKRKDKDIGSKKLKKLKDEDVVSTSTNKKTGKITNIGDNYSGKMIRPTRVFGEGRDRNEVSLTAKQREETPNFIKSPRTELIRRSQQEGANKSISTFETEQGKLTVGINQPTGITPEKTGFIENVKKAYKTIDTLGGMSPSAIAEEQGEELRTGYAPIIIPTGIAAAASGTARITQTKHAHEIYRGSLLGRGSITTQRSFVGKPANTGVNKLFKLKSKNAATAARYATNAKSTALTKNWLIGLGLSGTTIAAAIGAFGTYPWAAHNSREASEALTFGMRRALDAETPEQYDILAEEFDRTINESVTVFDELPGINVVKSSIQGMENAILVKQSMDIEREKMKGGI